MKYCALLLLLVSGCASTSLPVNDEMFCARSGYYPGGKSFTQTRGVVSSSANASAYNNNGDYAYASGSGDSYHKSSSTSIMCLKPQNEYEKCLSQKLRSPGSVRHEYNEGSLGREMVQIGGYVMLIIPGVIADYFYNKENKKLKNQTQPEIDRAYSECAKFN